MTVLLRVRFHSVYSLWGMSLNKSESSSNDRLIAGVILNEVSFCLSLIARSPAHPILAYMPVSVKLEIPYSLEAVPEGNPTSLALLMMLEIFTASASLGQK